MTKEKSTHRVRDTGLFCEENPIDDISQKLGTAKAVLLTMFDDYSDLNSGPSISQESACALLYTTLLLVESAERTANSIPYIPTEQLMRK